MMRRGIGLTTPKRSIGTVGLWVVVWFAVRQFLRPEDYAVNIPTVTGNGGENNEC